ncbi:hypothetical protein [Sulfuracidifex tepidarius]|uniref:Uncharacterized protein n=1 Tax=Sulfuracidifex tepidarius TaxID=1294262 RepID=A0A510DVU4_9CREN|nr:hypothetical protein [Sulfuracidifex tepidarius]BBG24088.1 hypothetical protein IC006_1389 [Sulfuracidifex tepidarius]BBG26843.1 hypothetical protein IC007_1364 [Sulfuracidifex tepidarius]
MAGVINRIKKRGLSISSGVLLVALSALLMWRLGPSGFTDFSFFFYGLDPVYFYLLGLVLGGERVVFGLTGSERLFKLIAGDGMMYYYSLMILVLILGVAGIYVMAFSFVTFSSLTFRILDIVDGIAFIVTAMTIWMK